MKLIKSIILIFILGNNMQLSAQKFNWTAEIPTVDKPGFYKIFLKPEVTSKLRYQYPDIRIYNHESEEIPFIYDTEKQMVNVDSVEMLNVLKNKHKKIKAYTYLLIKNDSLKSIDNFAFLTDNAEIRKWVRITASHDKKEWYVIKNNSPVQSAYSDSSKTELLLSNIPESKFLYYKITFYDYNNKKIKIYNAYTYRSELAQKNYSLLPEFEISHLDTLDRTLVHLQFKDPQFIDRIRLKIKGPKYFFRNVLLEKTEGAEQEQGELYYDEIKKELNFGSDTANIINLSHYKAKTVQLTIDNRDNQPLRIIEAKAYQQKTYIIAYLNAEKRYTVNFGDKYTEFPVYDLEYFTEQIPAKLQILEISNIKRLIPERNNLFTSKIWDFPILYLWIGVGIIGLLLLYLSSKVIWEQYKSGNNNSQTS